ncbi:hypothetical protein K493DRAFT_299024 [Basidiobolus meristosporus CBS 931.73]|uniref:Mid2 domain-containing protein n=1 Tax=Basidiobolus meristosporus CBS 931.73 TaxID=1314790 RepID=A0A1Y1YQ33_9FUNG|nr:hypothetical protein K493DRAFT_299024 [Basidiobolus meristosporus CBS 931.73]|eukprot:ORY00130.1 hypothetical protein K493DRAFT_299024 [Basidiobolus meristosporus CBS 931.73]
MSSWTHILLLTVLAISSARPAVLPIKPTNAPLSLSSHVSPIALPSPSTISHSIPSVEKPTPTPSTSTTTTHPAPTPVTTNLPNITDSLHLPAPEISTGAPSQSSSSIPLTDSTPAPASTPTPTSTVLESSTHSELSASTTHSSSSSNSGSSGSAPAAIKKPSIVTKVAIPTPPSSLNEDTERASHANDGNNRSLMAAGISVGVIVFLASVGIFIFRKWKLSPSHRFRTKLEEGKPYLQLPSRTGSRRDLVTSDQGSEFLKELHS